MIELSITTWIFLGLYLAATIVNLVFAFLENEKLRKITKPFCLVILFLCAVTWVPNYPFLYIGILFDLGGDILLIWKKKLKLFLAGSGLFFIGHIFYIIQALILFGQSFNWIFYVVVIFFLLLFNLLSYRLLRKTMKSPLIAILTGIYASSLILLLLVLISSCFVGYLSYMLIAALGMIAFMLSDGIIVFTKFVHKIKRQEFYIMSLYLLAQVMIIVGFCLTITTI